MNIRDEAIIILLRLIMRGILLILSEMMDSVALEPTEQAIREYSQLQKEYQGWIQSG